MFWKFKLKDSVSICLTCRNGSGRRAGTKIAIGLPMMYWRTSFESLAPREDMIACTEFCIVLEFWNEPDFYCLLQSAQFYSGLTVVREQQGKDFVEERSLILKLFVTFLVVSLHGEYYNEVAKSSSWWSLVQFFKRSMTLYMLPLNNCFGFCNFPDMQDSMASKTLSIAVTSFEMAFESYLGFPSLTWEVSRDTYLQIRLQKISGLESKQCHFLSCYLLFAEILNWNKVLIVLITDAVRLIFSIRCHFKWWIISP